MYSLYYGGHMSIIYISILEMCLCLANSLGTILKTYTPSHIIVASRYQTMYYKRMDHYHCNYIITYTSRVKTRVLAHSQNSSFHIVRSSNLRFSPSVPILRHPQFSSDAIIPEHINFSFPLM